MAYSFLPCCMGNLSGDIPGLGVVASYAEGLEFGLLGGHSGSLGTCVLPAVQVSAVPVGKGSHMALSTSPTGQ